MPRMKGQRTGKLAAKSPQARVANVRKATSQVKAKASINFTRSVRGR
jgi:hypothetical protein